jgi:hypothetical protein
MHGAPCLTAFLLTLMITRARASYDGSRCMPCWSASRKSEAKRGAANMWSDLMPCAVPTVERVPEAPPPFVVLVQGPPKVCQTTQQFYQYAALQALPLACTELCRHDRPLAILAAPRKTLGTSAVHILFPSLQSCHDLLWHVIEADAHDLPVQVGKSLLIRCLIKHYTRQSLSEVRGPVTIVAGKQRRLTFVECPQVRHSVPLLMRSPELPNPNACFAVLAHESLKQQSPAHVQECAARCTQKCVPSL